MTRSYWQKFDRGFANEYDVGVATTQESADQYADEGYSRISRDVALREICYRGDAATQAYVSVTLDGQQQDRFPFVRGLRNKSAER